MGCDYYIQSELIIEYIDVLGRVSFICTNRDLNRGYINEYLPDHDSDDDEETCYEKYLVEIEKKIKENTYDKILFENNNWVKESYKKKYEEYLRSQFKEICEFKKIYKKFTAWKRN